MQKLLAVLITQFNEFYKTLTPVKRNSMVAAAVVLVGALVAVSMILSGSNHVPLLRNVPPDQLPIVVEQLHQKNIPFILGDSGATVLVPKELLHSTQMAIMTEVGSGKIGDVGLELFEKENFGTTSYAQKVNYQRALQGELMRAINTLGAVKQSKVILALPPKKTFLEETAKPTASVVLDLKAGKVLSPEQVRGIAHLVASSVEGMDVDRVTVVDSRGKVLTRQYSQDGAATSDLLDVKTKIEENLENRIESILSKVVGAGKVIARVDASLNPRHTVTTEEAVDPDRTALKAQQTEDEILDGARTNPTGIPGARSNLPGAEDNGQIGFKQNVKKELKSSNFDVSKTIRNTKESAGTIERLSVAVLVDGRMDMGGSAKNQEGEGKWVSYSAEELAKFEAIVKNAVGFNGSRGDNVKIENIQFQKEDFGEAEKLLTNLEKRKLLYALFYWSLLGVALVLFFFIVVKPFMNWIADSFQDSVDDMLPKTIEELEELQSVDNTLPGMSNSLPVLEESLDPDKAESELLKERIVSLVEQDVEKAAGAFGLWLTRKDS
ncbi:MAG: flagellar M-ring protein FliF [Bdellovibrionales bacterium]|nr:flagellar M-ring protein FliF [Bdellovibrionales bacterium]